MLLTASRNLPALSRTVTVGHFITDQTDIRTSLIEMQIVRRLSEVSDVMFLFFIANENVLFWLIIVW